MPSVRSPLHYPKEYFELIRLAAVENKVTTVPCEDKATALKLRGHFYAFLGALKRAANANPPTYVEEYAWGQRTMCYFDGAVLSFMPRDNAWQAKLVRAALGTAAGVQDVPKQSVPLPPSLLQLLDVSPEEDD